MIDSKRKMLQFGEFSPAHSTTESRSYAKHFVTKSTANWTSIQYATSRGAPTMDAPEERRTSTSEATLSNHEQKLLLQLLQLRVGILPDFVGRSERDRFLQVQHRVGLVVQFFVGHSKVVLYLGILRVIPQS